MKTIKHPFADSVDSAVKNDLPMLAAISFSGETAIVAPSESVCCHEELLGEFGVGAKSFFLLRFNSRTADWSFDCPDEYKYISQRSEQLAEYYKDGARIIPEFLVMFGYF